MRKTQKTKAPTDAASKQALETFVSEAFARNGLPPAEGAVLDVKWVARTGDWWHRTAAGWFWLEARTREWKPAAYGPYASEYGR